MSKEYLEAFNHIRNKFIDLFHEDVPDFDTLEDALQRLETIDNANPSEALEETLRDIAYDLVDDDNPFLRDRYYGLLDLKQTLLKAEKEHNSVNLLMQELDCKIFAELRKYARCGYEKLNKKYLKWEDLDFKENNQRIKVKLGSNIYTLDFYIGQFGKTFVLNLQHYCEAKDNIQFFNDLHLERVLE